VAGYYLDTSALAKLYHAEAGSGRMESLAGEADARLIISQLSLIEMQSVFAGKVRTGVIGKAALDQLRGLFFSDLAKRRFEVVLLAHRHYQEAETLVRTYAVDYALRTLDALQLAVALDLRRHGAVSDLIASDRNLCNLATLLGLTVLNPSEGL
jgi:uncharacterized protein